MSWLDKLLNGVCDPKKEQKPKFHRYIPDIDYLDDNYSSYITSGGHLNMGWFKLSDEPLSKKLFVREYPEIIMELTGRYVEYGVGFAVELKEEQSWMPEEFIGLKAIFV